MTSESNKSNFNEPFNLSDSNLFAPNLDDTNQLNIHYDRNVKIIDDLPLVKPSPKSMYLNKPEMFRKTLEIKSVIIRKRIMQGECSHDIIGLKRSYKLVSNMPYFQLSTEQPTSMINLKLKKQFENRNGLFLMRNQSTSTTYLSQVTNCTTETDTDILPPLVGRGINSNHHEGKKVTFVTAGTRSSFIGNEILNHNSINSANIKRLCASRYLKPKKRGQYSSEQPGNMWLLKRSRKGMELNNPYAFNLKPQSLRSVIDRIPLLPLVGCSQLEYVQWKKQIQPCVPDSRYILKKSSSLQKIMYPEEMRTWVIPPKSLGYPNNIFQKDYTHYDEHTLTHRRSAYFFDEESRSMYRYHAVPRISKSDCNCCGMNKPKKMNSDVYMPVVRTPSQSTSIYTQTPYGSNIYSTTLISPVNQNMLESAQEKTVKSETRFSKKYLPMARSESISVLSKQSTITTESVEESRHPPPMPPKKKGFCHTFCPCCFGEGDDEHSVVIYQDAPRYVCKVTTPSLSGSSLQMEDGENLERRTKYICKLKS